MTDLLSDKTAVESDDADSSALMSTKTNEFEPHDNDAVFGEVPTLEAVVELLSKADSSRSTWVDQALCGDKTHLFFAPPGERRTRRTKREALAMSYCMQCPVKQECRAWARENRESGFWGGENEEQRAAAGFAPKSPNRRAVAEAARVARKSA